MTSDQLSYENRVMAYCDILGWSRAIERSTHDSDHLKKLALAIHSLSGHAQLVEFFRGEAGGTPWGLEIAHFSDSIVFSCPADDSQRFSTVAMRVNQLVYWLLTQARLLTRGAIVVGQLYHRKNVVLGPALAKAYLMESEIAVYPRILVADDVLAIARTDGKGLDTQKVKGDFDGLHYLDYLRVFGQPTGGPPLAVRLQESEHYLRCCREATVEGMEENSSDLKKYVKWLWLARYFNEVINDYPTLGIEKIPL